MSFGPVVAEDLKITSINDPSFPLDLIIERLKAEAELFAVDFPLLERIILYRCRICILETTPYILGLELRVDKSVGRDEILGQLGDDDDWSIIPSSLVGEYIDREKNGRLLYARNAGVTPDPPLPGLQTENQEQKSAEKPDESVVAGVPMLQTNDFTKGPEPHTTKQLFPCEEGTRWADIAITLISDDTVLIRTPVGRGRFSYHKLGFENQTRGNKAIAIWETLKMFCKLQGDISGSTLQGYDPKLVKKISLLNKHLRNLFGIKANFTLHFKKAKGYKSEILFRDETFQQEVTPSGYPKGRTPAFHSEY